MKNFKRKFLNIFIGASLSVLLITTNVLAASAELSLTPVKQWNKKTVSFSSFATNIIPNASWVETVYFN